MPEVLVETIPFAIGAALGLLMFDNRRPWPNLGWLGLGSVIVGALQAAFAGELAGGLLTGAAAIILDSAAVAVVWAIVHVGLRQGRALLRRAYAAGKTCIPPDALRIPPVAVLVLLARAARAGLVAADPAPG